MSLTRGGEDDRPSYCQTDEVGLCVSTCPKKTRSTRVRGGERAVEQAFLVGAANAAGILASGGEAIFILMEGGKGLTTPTRKNS